MHPKRGNRHKTALLFTGGGSRGAVEVGVLKVLAKHITPDVVIGTSIGAINAAAYASGIPPEKIERLWIEHVTNRLVFPTNWEFLYKFGNVLSICHQRRVKRFLEWCLPAKTFEDCKIPLYINATELHTGKSTFFHSGNLVRAILASSAIAPYYGPYTINGVKYVDGGVSNAIAIEEAKALKCSQVIVISAYGEREDPRPWNIFRLSHHELTMVMRTRLQNEIRLESEAFQAKHVVVISPKVPEKIRITNFSHSEELIRLGEREAKKVVHRIKT
jgi:NTE family protein